MIKLFGEPLCLKEKIVVSGSIITGYDGCYYIVIDLDENTVKGERLGVIENQDGVLVFRDGENYKEEITEKNIGRKYFPSDVDEEEAIKLLKQGEKVEAYEYDERELCNCARKAFEILRQKTEENPEVIENLGVVVYEDGKVEYRIFEETPYVLEENLDEISKPIEKPPKGIPRFGFCEKALLWRFER